MAARAPKRNGSVPFFRAASIAAARARAACADLSAELRSSSLIAGRSSTSFAVEATALHSGNPAFDALPAYFRQRLEPALQTLLEAATAAGEIRADVVAEELLGAVASLCMHAHGQGPEHARRMVALLVDGLRYGAKAS